MFAAIKEDFCQGMAKPLFTDRSKTAEVITKFLQKFMPVVEGRLPEKGFINGLSFPTMADLAILNIHSGFMPFGAALKLAGDPNGTKLFAPYPKFLALAKRTAEADGVKQYLAASKSFK